VRGWCLGEHVFDALPRGASTTMIVRVLTATIAPDNVGEANAVMRPFLSELRGQPGLEYAKLARRLGDDDSEEMVLIEEWRTPAHLLAWTGGRLQNAHLPERAPHLFENLVIAHYESLDRLPEEFGLDVLDGSGPAAGAGSTGTSAPSAPPTARSESRSLRSSQLAAELRATVG
jgi:quinol monooxygenase YgiN